MNDKHFIDWESDVFGYGYGTGEGHTIKALKDFMECIPPDDSYSYETLEKKLTPTVTWLMINILCHADILEYGTSPRFGWLSDKGKILKKYITGKSEDELYNLTSVTEGYISCGRTYCNCEVKCKNPLF